MINWKLRLGNKATLTAILMAAVSIVYTVLGMCGVVPSVTQSQVGDLVAMVVQLLTLLGVVVDPTTEGVSDSARAMGYEEPERG